MSGQRPFRRGLVVGKFSPLHRGHMHLIQTALDACAEVYVISYSKPEFEGCGRAAREGWITSLFPQARTLVIDDQSLESICARLGIVSVPLPPNEAADAVHRELIAWLCVSVWGVTVDAVFTSEDYGDGFAQHLSDYFCGRALRTRPVVHVCVDRTRLTIPISGTRVRAAVHAHREFLDPRVYGCFAERVCLLGGESSGKTTLAKALAEQLGTVWAPEVGRERWEEKAGKLDFGDMREIAEAQVAREEQLSQRAARWLICDGSALTTAFYSMDGYGLVDPVVDRLAKRTYAHTFVCAPDFPFVQDGTRRDTAFRLRQHYWYLQTLEAASVRFTVLSGPVANRLEAACRILREQAEG